MTNQYNKDDDAIDERRERVVALTRQGMSAVAIADKMDITTQTVVRDRLACGIAKTSHKRIADEERPAIKALLEDGCPYSEVARTFGYTDTTIKKHFPGYGLSPEDAAVFNRAQKLFKKIIAEGSSTNGQSTY